MSEPRDYDFITTCNWTETGTFFISFWQQLFYRKKGSSTWIESYGQIEITSTGEWELANNFDDPNQPTHNYESITAIDACTEIYINEEALGTSVGDNFLYNLFINCTNLTSLPEGFNLPQNLQSAGNNFLVSAFYGCSSLTSMPEGFNLPQNLTSVGYSFLSATWYYCSNLTSLPEGFNLPQNLQTTGYGFMASCWSDCWNLTSMPDGFNLPQNLTSIGNEFLSGTWRACNKLTSLPLGFSLPEVLTDMSNNQILQGCWEGCSSLSQDGYTEDLIFKFEARGVFQGTYFDPGYIINGSSTNPVLIPISRTLPPTAEDHYVVTFRRTGDESDKTLDRNTWQDVVNFINGNKHSLTKISFETVNDPDKPVDFNYLFAEAPYLANVDLSGLDTSEVTNMGQMFYNCQNLTNLDLSGLDTSNVTEMGGMFWGCQSLTDLDLSYFDTTQVINISYMFAQCANLETLDISSFDTSNVIYIDSLFLSCSSLTELDLSHFNTELVTDMRDMFHGCQSLTSLNLNSFQTGAVTNMSNMFQDCVSLTEVTLGSFDTSQVIEMQSMFHGCTELTYLNLDSFNTSSLQWSNSMFAYCSKLESIVVSNNWTNDKLAYSKDMFLGCTSLVGAVAYNPNKVNGNMANWTTGYFTNNDQPQPPAYLPIELELTNCQSSIDDEIETGSNIPVTFTANEGFEFTQNGKLYYNEGGVAKEVDIIVTQSKQFTAYFNILANFTNIRLELSASKEPEPEPEPEPQSASSYTNQSMVENVLQRSLTSEEQAIIETAIEAVSSSINAYTGRKWLNLGKKANQIADEVKRFDGNGKRELFIDDFISISKIRLLNGAGGVDSTLAGNSVIFYPLNTVWKNSIYLTDRRLPNARSVVEITGKFYTGEVPVEIQLACATLVGHLFASARNVGDFERESIEGYSYDILTGGEKTAQEKATLDKIDYWRKVSI